MSEINIQNLKDKFKNVDESFKELSEKLSEQLKRELRDDAEKVATTILNKESLRKALENEFGEIIDQKLQRALDQTFKDIKNQMDDIKKELER